MCEFPLCNMGMCVSKSDFIYTAGGNAHLLDDTIKHNCVYMSSNILLFNGNVLPSLNLSDHFYGTY